MRAPILDSLKGELSQLQKAGVQRRELVLEVPPGPTITINKRELHHFCGADYLGFANHPEVKRAAKAAADAFGAGTASPRAVAGTAAAHVELERAAARFFLAEEALAFGSEVEAALGVFEALLGEKDAVFCDAQVSPHIADGLRLCRANVTSYRTRDLGDLEDRLRRSRAARFRAIVTDGIFALDGAAADLPGLASLAEQYQALLVVEDGEGAGVLGPSGRGAADAQGVTPKVDLLLAGFGRALGGGAGAIVAGRRELVAWLRQRSRPYLTSAPLAPASAATAERALELCAAHPELRQQLQAHGKLLRSLLQEQGFKVLGGEHPAVSVILGAAEATQRVADLLFQKGVFALGFCHPVVPQNAARIRFLLTAKHAEKAVRDAAAAFVEAAKSVGLR